MYMCACMCSLSFLIYCSGLAHSVFVLFFSLWSLRSPFALVTGLLRFDCYAVWVCVCVSVYVRTLEPHEGQHHYHCCSLDLTPLAAQMHSEGHAHSLYPNARTDIDGDGAPRKYSHQIKKRMKASGSVTSPSLLSRCCFSLLSIPYLPGSLSFMCVSVRACGTFGMPLPHVRRLQQTSPWM